MIQIEHLTRRFHDLVAVDDVSLDVQQGEVVGFLGPNGAGKSTTIRILTGFLPASSGRAVVGGHDVATHSLEARRLIGYLPELVPLPLDARVDEYLDFRARIKGVPRSARKARRAAVVEQTGLGEMQRRILSQLSRGYRQRVGLADALIADPPVLILDEPTGGLDPGQRQDVLDLIATLRGERTVLLSSHVLAEVDRISTRVAIIHRGKLLAVGTKDELEQKMGRRGDVEIGVEGDTAALVAWLGARDIESHMSAGGRVVAHVGEGADHAELLKALVDAGQPITRFEPLTRSLHELFLELTRGAEVTHRLSHPAPKVPSA